LFALCRNGPFGPLPATFLIIYRPAVAPLPRTFGGDLGIKCPTYLSGRIRQRPVKSKGPEPFIQPLGIKANTKGIQCAQKA